MDIYAVELSVIVVVGCIDTAVVALHGRKHRAWGDAGLLTLSHIDVEEVLRILRVVGRHGVGYLRTLVELREEVLSDIEEIVYIATSSIRRVECQTAGSREALHHWRLEGENLRSFDRGRLLVDHAEHHLRTEVVDIKILHERLFLVALLKRLELHDERSLVGTLACDEVVTRDTHGVPYCRIGSQHGVYLVHHFVSLLHTGARRGGYSGEHGTRILIGDKSRLGVHGGDSQHYDAHNHCHNGEHRALHEFAHPLLVVVEQHAISSVERCVEAVDGRHLALAAVFVLRFQKYCTECRREREGVKCRDDNRDGHCQTELSVEST